MPPGFAGSGTLETTEVTLSSLTSGKILTLSKEEGDRVKKDELLATIDVEKIRLQRDQMNASFSELDANKISADAAVSQAKDNLENIRLKYNRMKELVEKGSTTQQQFDDISTQLRLAESQLTAAQSQISMIESKKKQLTASIALLDRQIEDGKITCPIDGFVLEKYAEPGEVVPLGGPIYKVADLSRFWLKIYMAEPDLGKMVLGMHVKVRMDAVKEPIMGKITWVASESEFTPKNVQTRTSRSELVYAVKVTLEKSLPELKIGMPAEVYFQ